jgi:hypothetical protein
MARLARLAIAHQAHLVLLRGHSGPPVFRDDVDRAAFPICKKRAIWSGWRCTHYVAPDHAWLLCTPASVSLWAAQRCGFRGWRFLLLSIGAVFAWFEAMVFADQAPFGGWLIRRTLAAWSSASTWG